ncbi:hypothetical protein V1478_014091 [Vespula squamosa]|uniref:Uncharacterized protein n=1 Tax=Vespula squamosa TaxID=30214 RepID=A0ABD2A754_VESSQ
MDPALSNGVGKGTGTDVRLSGKSMRYPIRCFIDFHPNLRDACFAHVTYSLHGYVTYEVHVNEAAAGAAVAATAAADSSGSRPVFRLETLNKESSVRTKKDSSMLDQEVPKIPLVGNFQALSHQPNVLTVLRII